MPRTTCGCYSKDNSNLMMLMQQLYKWLHLLFCSHQPRKGMKTLWSVSLMGSWIESNEPCTGQCHNDHAWSYHSTATAMTATFQCSTRRGSVRLPSVPSPSLSPLLSMRCSHCPNIPPFLHPCYNKSTPSPVSWYVYRMLPSPSGPRSRIIPTSAIQLPPSSE